MLGSASILAICALAALPAGEAEISDSSSPTVITRAAFQRSSREASEPAAGDWKSDLIQSDGKATSKKAAAKKRAETLAHEAANAPAIGQQKQNGEAMPKAADAKYGNNATSVDTAKPNAVTSMPAAVRKEEQPSAAFMPPPPAIGAVSQEKAKAESKDYYSDKNGEKPIDPTIKTGVAKSSGEKDGKKDGEKSEKLTSEELNLAYSDGMNARDRWVSGITAEAWVDQGVTLNTLSPRDRSNGTVGYNNRSNEYELNQAYIRLKRDVDKEGCNWDVGGCVDMLYGTDWIYTKARGLEVYDDLSNKWNSDQYGLAMPQMYAEFFTPWGNGLSVKVGHYYSISGYETAVPTENFFYSHSYAFLYGEPTTYTGFLGETKLGDFTIQAGMTRGWDNWEDDNNDLAFTGAIRWASEGKRTQVALTADAGREQPDDSSSVRTLLCFVFQQKLGERWEYVFQCDYGNEPDAGVNDTTAAWGGVNQYLFYTFNETWKAGMRFEWFRDQNGSRIADVGRTCDYYTMSEGVNWTPNKYVTVRPEIRYDWTGTEGCRPFGDGTRTSQLLLDCDVVVHF